jgi:hypothetical protein
MRSGERTRKQHEAEKEAVVEDFEEGDDWASCMSVLLRQPARLAIALHLLISTIPP